MAQAGTEENPTKLPEELHVSIIMECRPSSSEWADEYWQAAGVVVGSHGDGVKAEPRKIFDEQDVQRYLHPGFSLRLHVDECESYYHNLVSPQPRCYVITQIDEHGIPQPLLVSMCFDEAHAYHEGEDEIFAVDIPPEVYVWTEAFVIANYFPQKKTKRRLVDWKDSTDRGH